MNVVASSPRTLANVPKGRAVMWWLIISEITIFGGFITCYLLYRIRHADMAEAAQHTSTLLGTLNTFILLTSGLFVSFAGQASEKGGGKKAARWLGLTCLLAMTFLGVKALEYTHEIEHGFTPGKHLFWSFYYGLTGLHGLHILGGIIAMTLIALGAKKNQNLGRVDMVGMYWHLVDAVWIFLFVLFYVIR